MNRKIARFGWWPDTPHPEDAIRQFNVNIALGFGPREMADWRSKLPPVEDQGDLGTCTAHSTKAAIQCEYAIRSEVAPEPSRLFLYYNSGLIEGVAGQDVGRQNRDCILSLIKDGICPEAMWQYSKAQQSFAPSSDCYAAAQKEELLDYSWVDNQSYGDLIAALRIRPIIFGFSVPASFEGPEIARTGIMQMPKTGEAIVGGHSVLLVGEDPQGYGRLLVRNSWGEGWGQGGYFWMPRDFITSPDWCSDFWMIQRM